jgi:hypothetical protein
MRSLILHAIEESYPDIGKGGRVTAPLIDGKGKRGPRFPIDENPWELILF